MTIKQKNRRLEAKILGFVITKFKKLYYIISIHKTKYWELYKKDLKLQTRNFQLWAEKIVSENR